MQVTLKQIQLTVRHNKCRSVFVQQSRFDNQFSIILFEPNDYLLLEPA